MTVRMIELHQPESGYRILVPVEKILIIIEKDDCCDVFLDGDIESPPSAKTSESYDEIFELLTYFDDNKYVSSPAVIASKNDRGDKK